MFMTVVGRHSSGPLMAGEAALDDMADRRDSDQAAFGAVVLVNNGGPG